MRDPKQIDSGLEALVVGKRVMIFPFLTELGDEIDSVGTPCSDAGGGALKLIASPLIGEVIKNSNRRLSLRLSDWDCISIEYGDVKNFVKLADRI